MRNFFSRFAYLVALLVAGVLVSNTLFGGSIWIKHPLDIFIIVLAVNCGLVFNSMIGALSDTWQADSLTKHLPLKGFEQAIQAIFFLVLAFRQCSEFSVN
ncbi:MAG: hypothetical protein MUO26_06720 [Methanotrichaceae archaeon]|nr:hypothetical protein [Methanotrichaceae archaeon]